MDKISEQMAVAQTELEPKATKEVYLQSPEVTGQDGCEVTPVVI